MRYGDGWYPNASSGDPDAIHPGLPPDGAGGRARPEIPVVRLGGAPDDLDELKRYRDLGVDAVNVTLMSDKRRDPADPRPLGRLYPQLTGSRQSCHSGGPRKHGARPDFSAARWISMTASRPGMTVGMGTKERPC